MAAGASAQRLTVGRTQQPSWGSQVDHRRHLGLEAPRLLSFASGQGARSLSLLG
jgi:hypothetical protein